MATAKDTRSFGNMMEEAYGFSRAGVGDTVYVSGQTAMAEDYGRRRRGDMAAQMREAYAGVARVLAMYGADMGNVVDEVLFVTDLMAAAMCAKAVRGEVYGELRGREHAHRRAALGSPDLMIEIKCVAHALMRYRHRFGCCSIATRFTTSRCATAPGVDTRDMELVSACLRKMSTPSWGRA